MEDMKRHMRTYGHMKIHEVQRYICELCKKTFTRKWCLNRHVKIHSREKPYICAICSKAFTRKSDLNRHIMSHGRTVRQHECLSCKEKFTRKSDLFVHIRMKHTPKSENIEIKKPRRPNLPLCSVSRFHPSEESKEDFRLFFSEVRLQLVSQIKDVYEEIRTMEWYAITQVGLFRFLDVQDPECDPPEIDYVKPEFLTECMIELSGDMIEQHVEEAFSQILNSFKELIEGETEWMFDKIIHFKLCCGGYHPVR